MAKPVPQGSKTEELRALVRKHAHKAASGWTAWTFDDYTYDNLKNYLLASGDKNAKKAAEKAGATRDDLYEAAQSAYTSASSAGGDTYASATSYLAKATDSAKQSVFDNWSESELKAYLDGYGFVSLGPYQAGLSRTKTSTACSAGVDRQRTARICSQAVHVLQIWHYQSDRDRFRQARRERQGRHQLDEGTVQHWRRCGQEADRPGHCQGEAGALNASVGGIVRVAVGPTVACGYLGEQEPGSILCA